jgi:hypothetical protein
MRNVKWTLLLAFLMVWAGNAKADNVLTTNSVSIRPGSTAELVVSLESNADFSVYAYDFRLYLPAGIEVEQNSLGVYQYELKERNAGHAVNVQATSDGSVQFGVSSPTLALTGNTGEVLGITLRAEDGLAEGTYQAAIKFVTYANKEAQTVHPADITFDIEVRNMMILDENAVTPPETASNVNVKVLRTINAGEWSTICLPFAMTEEQVTTAFGDDVELGDFTGYTTEEDAGENITGIRVHFDPATAIEANHPYIIKVSQAVSEFTADGVDVEPEDEPTVAAVKRTKKQWSEFIGTYVAGTTVDYQMLFLSGNQFWYSTGQTQMKAFRGYFDFYDVLTEVENAANISFFVGDEATEISLTPNAPVDEGGIYDLQGRKLNGNIQLPKGVYIQNGKKVVK